MQGEKDKLFTGFGGVALADILANSVAIMIILIVITLLVKQEQEEKRLEKIDEVSVLLSRELATSVVMNKLPTSPPVRLHDYQTSPMDRNPQFHLMPIIELHTDYIRDYYHNEKISFEELLLPNNAFDRYLDRLNEFQLRRMRVDVYDVRLFYIAMSILKKRGHWPGHWHFLQSDKKQKGGRYAKNEEREEPPAAEEAENEENQEPGEPQDVGRKLSGNNLMPGGTFPSLGAPDNANLHLSENSGQEAYPYDDLAFTQQGGQEEERQGERSMPDLPGQSGRQSETQKTSDQMFAALSGLFGEEEGQNGQKGEPKKMLFRSARHIDQDQNAQGQPGDVLSLPFDSLMAALFAFMKRAQAAVDEGQFDVLDRYSFQKDIAPYIGRVLIEANLWNTVQLLRQASQKAVAENTEPVFVSVKKISAENMEKRNTLVVPVNTRLQSLQLRQTESQEKPENVPGEVIVTTRLSLFPEIYKGIQTDFNKNGFVLMHPEQAQADEYRWRVVTYVEPDLSQFITSFVYAKLDGDHLMLSNEENDVKVNHVVLTTDYPILPLRKERWMLILYGLSALFVVLSLLSRLRA